MIVIYDSNRRALVSGFYNDLLSILKIIESTAFGVHEAVMLRLRGLV